MERILVAVFAIISVLLLYLYRENKRFVVTHYELRNKKLNHLEDAIKIAVLSDLHNHVYGTDNEPLVKAIDKEDPDLILVAGDLLVAKPNHETTVALSLMEKLGKKYPVYYGNGNHEYRMRIYPEVYEDRYERYAETLKKYNVTLLENEHATVSCKGQKLAIYGLEIEREYYKRLVRTNLPNHYINGLLGRVDPNQYTILLAHNPSYFKDYSEWGADLTLSGHIHGGLVNVPFLGGVASPQIELFPKYDAGLFQENDNYMVLSRGLGTHTINVRVNNPAELVIITLKK